MKETDLAALKKKLEEERALLEEELEATGRKNPDHPNGWEARPDNLDVLAADENEVADKLESYQENQSVMGELAKRYRQVINALKRIFDKSYGKCRICSKPIESERLAANPAADTCIAHKDR